MLWHAENSHCRKWIGFHVDSQSVKFVHSIYAYRYSIIHRRSVHTMFLHDWCPERKTNRWLHPCKVLRNGLVRKISLKLHLSHESQISLYRFECLWHFCHSIMVFWEGASVEPSLVHILLYHTGSTLLRHDKSNSNGHISHVLVLMQTLQK